MSVFRAVPGLATPVAVDAAEFDLSIDARDGRSTARVVYLVRDGDLATLVAELVGGWQVVGSSVAWVTPHAHWRYPWMTCESVASTTPIQWVDGGPANPADPLSAVAAWRVECVYSPAPAARGTPDEKRLDPSDPATIFEVSKDVSPKFVTLKDGVLEIGNPSGPFGPPKPFNGQFGALTVDAEFRLKFPLSRGVPWSREREYIGRINSADLDALEIPRHCALFAGVQTTRRVSATGVPSDEVSIVILAQDRDWNTIVGEAGEVKLVRYAGSSPVRYPFDEIDFAGFLS